MTELECCDEYNSSAAEKVTAKTCKTKNLFFFSLAWLAFYPHESEFPMMHEFNSKDFTARKV